MISLPPVVASAGRAAPEHLVSTAKPSLLRKKASSSSRITRARRPRIAAGRQGYVATRIPLSRSSVSEVVRATERRRILLESKSDFT